MDNFRIEHFNNPEEWHALRSKGIGGSDAGIIMGVNRYKNQYQLWEEKAGISKLKSVTNEAIEKGNAMEPLLLQIFPIIYKDYEVIDTKNETYVSSFWDVARANLDGKLRNANGELGILEIKTATIRNSSQLSYWKDQVPESYYWQVIHYMAVTGYTYAELYALIDMPFWHKQELRKYHFDRIDCEDDIARLVEEEIKFWHNVETRTPPRIYQKF